MNGNLFVDIERAAGARPDGICMALGGDVCWRYAELIDVAARFAGALREARVAPGARVLVQVAKSPEAVALYLACLALGGVYVPLNVAYTAEELRYFIGDAEPRLLVTDPRRAEEHAGEVEILTLGAAGEGTLARAAGDARPIGGAVTVAAGDIAAIVYTSGTTGRSKGAMLTHGNLASNARALIDHWGWRDDDVLLHALPIFHVHGLFVALHCALLTATPLIFQPRFDTDAVIEALPRCTVLMGVPTFYTRLLASPRFTAASVAGMRVFISGSAPLTEQTFEAFAARTGHRILERYGMSEALMITSNPLDGERRPGTVGYALPGIECRIAGEDGGVLPADEVGGIEVRGPNVFKGYWRAPEKTRGEFRADGFFRTGDLGHMDDRGRVSIVGRARDLIISGGYNVYPREIERLIDELPGVAESAVIGVGHADLGEAVVAVVVRSDEALGADAVMAALNGRLARFKQPKRVLFAPALPRNAMGKVQKKALRDAHADVLVATASE